MTEQPPPKRGARGALLGCCCAVSACLAVAAAAAFALDQGLVAWRARQAAAGRPAPDRLSLAAPSPERWRSAPLPPGTPAPPFSLPDVRTGRRVSLEECRGSGPAVLLLSSFG
jgi:hypothetical protein